jgi:glycosyltransferase involved in cell wall biosynthesis
MSGDAQLISVVVPAYNAERWIAATLDSVAAQTHRALEVIIVDDGSTDGTVAIAEAFARRDPRFRVVRQANAGVAAARNHGASLAQSDLLAFVDADDLWSPDKTKRQLAALAAAGPGTGLCYSWYVMIDGADTVIYREPGRIIEGEVLDTLFVENFIGNGSAALVRREAFDRVGGFEPALRNASAQGCEDILFYCRVAEHYRFAVAPGYHIGYRQLPDNMSSDLTRMLRSWFMVVDEMAARHPDKRALLDRGVARYARWVMRRAIHRRRPTMFLRLLALLGRRRPALAVRMAMIEAPRTVIEPFRAQPAPPAAEPAVADDPLANGRRFNG